MGAAVVIILRKQRDIVEVFEGARATSPETARDPNDLGIDESVIFRGLVRRAVLRDAGGGRYYIDQPSWRAMSSMRHRVAMVVLAIVVVLLVVGLIVGTVAIPRL